MKYSAILVAIGALVASKAAHAGELSATSGEHLTGLELMLRPGFGGAPAASPVSVEPAFFSDPSQVPSLVTGAAPYRPGFVGQAFLGYRFHPLASAGLRGGLRTVGASSVGGLTDLERRAWDAGLYARVYPLALSETLRKYVDPWASVGVGFMRDTQSASRSVLTSAGSVPFTFGVDHFAVAVPLGIGVDYRVLSRLSIGPSFEYALALSQGGCIEFETSAPGLSGSTYCSMKAPGSKFVKAESYGVWTAGLDVKLTF